MSTKSAPASPGVCNTPLPWGPRWQMTGTAVPGRRPWGQWRAGPCPISCVSGGPPHRSHAAIDVHRGEGGGAERIALRPGQATLDHGGTYGVIAENSEHSLAE